MFDVKPFVPKKPARWLDLTGTDEKDRREIYGLEAYSIDSFPPFLKAPPKKGRWHLKTYLTARQ
jgi:hypothetical protein